MKTIINNLGNLAVVDPGEPGDPLFLDQNEAQTAENLFLETEPLPYLRVWIWLPPPPSESLDPPLFGYDLPFRKGFWLEQNPHPLSQIWSEGCDPSPLYPFKACAHITLTDITANMIIIKHLQEETNLGVVKVFNDPWTQLNKSCSDFNVIAS